MPNIPFVDGSEALRYLRSNRQNTNLDPAVSNEDLLNSLGQPADAEASSNTGAFALISLFKRLLNTALAGLPTALGIGTKSTSVPVVLASDQPSRPISMSAISLSAVSGDQTILTPSSGKSLHIFSLLLTNSATATTFILKQGTTGQGQSNLTGTITVFDYAQDFSTPIGLATNKSFVVNLPTTGTLNGFVAWREE